MTFWCFTVGLAALSAGAGETVFFLEATALFVLATAEVYGIPLDHRERRRWSYGELLATVPAYARIVQETAFERTSLHLAKYLPVTSLTSGEEDR